MTESKIVHTEDTKLLVPRRVTNITDYASPPAGMVAEEISTGRLLRNHGTPTTPSWREYAPAPPWQRQLGAGSVFGTLEDGDPNTTLNALLQPSISLGFYLNQGTNTAARGSRFRLPRRLTLITGWHFALIVGSAVFVDAFYRASDGARLHQSTPYDLTTANAWDSVAYTGLVLEAETDYWYFFGSSFAGAAAYMTGPPPGHNVGAYGPTAPFLDQGAGLREFAQFPVTNAAFPATMSGLTSAAWASNVAFTPVPLLEGTAA